MGRLLGMQVLTTYHSPPKNTVRSSLTIWQCYWAELDGNGTVSWLDADLTANGVAQAQIAADFWQHEITYQKIPYPQSYYTSPMTRCLRTTNITFSQLSLPEYYPFVPTVKELLRESIDIHTCDRRRSKSYIENLFPNYVIEAGFTEYDELWDGVTGETSLGQEDRSKVVLDEIFSSDDHTWISITSHSGEIGAILSALGHQSFSLSTGAVIPVLVKAQFLETGSNPLPQARTASTHCAAPPVTSISSLSQGCVCPGTASAGITTPIFSDSTSAAAYVARTAIPRVYGM
jgi:broad specificity phosphatase PhoE